MKRLPLGIAVILLLASCSAILTDTYITFEDVSQPYLDRRGPPEEVTIYTSSDYATNVSRPQEGSIDWWWWTQGFGVTFLNTPFDYVYGWTVDSTHSFEPIP